MNRSRPLIPPSIQKPTETLEQPLLGWKPPTSIGLPVLCLVGRGRPHRDVSSGLPPPPQGGLEGPGGPPPSGSPHLWTPAVAGAPPGVAGLAPPRWPRAPTQAGGPHTRRSRRPTGAGSPPSQAWTWGRRAARCPGSRTCDRCTRTCRRWTRSRSRRRSARRSLEGAQALSAVQGAPCEGAVGLRGVPGAGMPRIPTASFPPAARGVSGPSSLAHTPAHHLLTTSSPLSGMTGSLPHVTTGVWPWEWDPLLPSLLEPLKLHLRHQPEKGSRSGRPPPGPATGMTTQPAEGSCKQKDRKTRQRALSSGRCRSPGFAV